MPLVSGTKLGPYEIISPLGAGGMGEVYRARDKRLGRDAAIKVLPEAFAGDAQRMGRFEREAKVLASLNHPNIAVLYGFEESNRTRALVMELVDGATLAERIKQGPLAIEEALPTAKQMAEALEYAHARGIIHRDLKPSNVKLTPDGQVKLLDFGLAKALEGETSEEELQNSPTLSAAATRAGMMLGTAAYMAPEQARGKRVDRRADIWAFGCVLYEMLTGRGAFDGETTSDILAGVIRAEPDWTLLDGSVPPRIRELIRRCLQKDPKQRLQAIGEARIAVDGAIDGSSNEALGAQAKGPTQALWRSVLPWGIAAVGVAAALLFGGSLLRERPAVTHPVMRASVMLPERLSGVFSANPGSPIAISPDGSRLVFVGAPAGKPSQLYLRQLDEQAATPIPNTEEAIQPFFSPDGQWVGFFANGKMRKVLIHGGPVTPLCEAQIPHGASWTTDDAIIYAPDLGSGLMRISPAGSSPQTLTTPNAKEKELSHRWPQLLPGSKAVLFTIQMSTQASYDDAHIAVLSLQTGKWRTLLEGGSYARYVPSGHIVYAHAGTLMAVPFDLAGLRLTGPAIPAQEGVITTPATSGSAEYDVADSGLLAYVPGSARPPERALVWVDRQGNAKELPVSVNTYVTPRLSPDGKLLAVQILSSGAQDIWIYEFARNTLTRLSFGEGAVPVWTPDNRRVIYRRRTPSFSLLSKLVDGTGTEENLLGNDFDDASAAPFSVSPDGRTLLFGRYSSTGATEVDALSLDGSGKFQPFLQSKFNQGSAHFSPDGRWVAYGSNQSGRGEIYVQPFPATGGKWMVSTEGGVYPLWASNGGEIFFRNDDRMMSASVETRPAFKAGTPRVLFQAGSYLGVGGSYVASGNYDVAPDGQHFLMIKEKDAPASSKEVSIVVHWTDELKRIAPTSR